jgi:hypothetical protein
MDANISTLPLLPVHCTSLKDVKQMKASELKDILRVHGVNLTVQGTLKKDMLAFQ